MTRNLLLLALISLLLIDIPISYIGVRMPGVMEVNPAGRYLLEYNLPVILLVKVSACLMAFFGSAYLSYKSAVITLSVLVGAYVGLTINNLQVIGVL